MTPRFETPERLRQAGIAALVDALGPVDATNFLRLFDAGEGDYSAERHSLLGDPDVGQLMAELDAWRKLHGPSPPND